MKILWLSLVLAVGTISPVLSAADQDEPDAESVRQWVDEGRILPLEELLERHRDRLHGELLDLQVEREHGRIIYELEIMDSRGRVREIYLDAASGEWLGEEPED